MTKVLSVTLVLMGAVLLTVAHFTETFVDEDGILHESFAQSGMGYLLVIGGLVTGLVAWRRKPQNPEPPI